MGVAAAMLLWACTAVAAGFTAVKVQKGFAHACNAAPFVMITCPPVGQAAQVANEHIMEHDAAYQTWLQSTFPAARAPASGEVATTAATVAFLMHVRHFSNGV